ncbi:helix-turn-helix transcriptional regulator [Devosia aurantiaca]|uniref:LuxR family transcriptional regulator n=1 Tax=Devosia aurantiaca TaxID=2714858 RepID=A0A6M1SVM9_9HYPH|nr:LuxR family transcriptional regulator [Devosia aurantiaca]NGP16981.1 LuxR family transcriptional regulator [Devosia aurantiaca]
MVRTVMAASTDFDRLDHSRTERMFWRTFKDIISTEGLDFYIFLWQRPGTPLFHRSNLHRSNLPAEFYAGAEHDPFLKYCCNTMGVTLAGADFSLRRAVLTREENAFVELTAQAGWRSGIAIPVQTKRHRDFGGFNLGSSMAGPAFEAAVQPRIDRLRALCFYAFRVLEQRVWFLESLGRQKFELSGLTSRQREVAVLLGEGLDRDAISQRLGNSVQTVATHQKAIYKRLDVRSQRELMQLLRTDTPKAD